MNQLQPPISFPISDNLTDEKNHASKLKIRLQLAYYKLMTNQTSVSLKELQPDSNSLDANVMFRKTKIEFDYQSTNNLIKNELFIDASTPRKKLSNLPTLSDFSESKSFNKIAKPNYHYKKQFKNKKIDLKFALNEHLSKIEPISPTQYIGNEISHMISQNTDSTAPNNYTNDSTVSFLTPVKDLIINKNTIDNNLIETPSSIGAAKSLLQLALLRQ